MPAGAAFSHLELFRRFPELRHIPVEIRPHRTIGDVTAMREAGFAQGEGGPPAYAEVPGGPGDRARIVITASTPEEAKRKFLQEMYPFIARMEGLPEGGSPASAMAELQRIGQSIDNQLAGAVERFDALAGEMSPAERNALVQEIARLTALGEGMDQIRARLTPGQAYERLAGRQMARATAAQMGLSEAELRRTPITHGMTVPPEEQIIAEQGPGRQFSVDVNPAKGVFAPPSPALAWTRLPDLPFRANLENIATKRRQKLNPKTGELSSPAGMHGPNGDLHTTVQVRAHIEAVLGGVPDVAWVDPQRSGRFSLLLVKFGDEFDRVVPVKLSAGARRVEQEIPTVFNQSRADTHRRLLAAFFNEHMGGREDALARLGPAATEGVGVWRVKWPRTLAGNQALLRVLEQAPESERKSSWHEFTALLKAEQEKLQPAQSIYEAERPRAQTFGRELSYLLRTNMPEPRRMAPLDPRSPLAQPGVMPLIERLARAGESNRSIVAQVETMTGVRLSQGQAHAAVLRLRREAAGRGDPFDVAPRGEGQPAATPEPDAMKEARQIVVTLAKEPGWLSPPSNTGERHIGKLIQRVRETTGVRLNLTKVHQILREAGTEAPEARGKAPDADPASAELREATRSAEIGEILKACKS
jgi:hypothetical protein